MRRRMTRRKMTGREYRQYLRTKVREAWGSRYNGRLVSSLKMDELDDALREVSHLKAEESIVPSRHDLPPGVVYLDVSEPVLAQDYAAFHEMIADSKRHARTIIFAAAFPDE